MRFDLGRDIIEFSGKNFSRNFHQIVNVNEADERLSENNSISLLLKSTRPIADKSLRSKFKRASSWLRSSERLVVRN